MIELTSSSWRRNVVAAQVCCVAWCGVGTPKWRHLTAPLGNFAAAAVMQHLARKRPHAPVASEAWHAPRAARATTTIMSCSSNQRCCPQCTPKTPARYDLCRSHALLRTAARAHSRDTHARLHSHSQHRAIIIPSSSNTRTHYAKNGASLIEQSQRSQLSNSRSSTAGL
jgi:hypothetical protein